MCKTVLWKCLRRPKRSGAAIVELALLLPLLMLMLMASVDFARVYFYTQLVIDCARNGAMYASHADIADKSPYENFTEATLAGATNLSPTPTATLKMVADATGQEMAEVTVSYRFRPFLPLQIKSELVLIHTARMRV